MAVKSVSCLPRWAAPFIALVKKSSWLAVHVLLVAALIAFTEIADFRPLAMPLCPSARAPESPLLPALIHARHQRDAKAARASNPLPVRLDPMGYTEVVGFLQPLHTAARGATPRFRLVRQQAAPLEQAAGVDSPPLHSEDVSVWIYPTGGDMMIPRVAAALVKELLPDPVRIAIVVEIDGAAAPSAGRLTGPFATSYFSMNRAAYFPHQGSDGITGGGCGAPFDMATGPCAVDWGQLRGNETRALKLLESQAFRFSVRLAHAAADVAKTALQLLFEGRSAAASTRQCRVVYWLLPGHPPPSLSSACGQTILRL